MALPYEILGRKRAGEPLSAAEVRALVAGAADGSWSDAQVGAFLMAAAIRGMNADETRTLTLAMLESGEQWRLASEVPRLCDKHSTGGVGDKVSLPLAPLLAACGLPVVMLTGRALGHTGGTADKLEAVPGLRLGLDRESTLRLLRDTGIAIGIATGSIAPADKRLYQLRDQTATVSSLPLITASILSKKLAAGAGALVLDVKVGSGAILPEVEQARELAELLVATANALGLRTSGWLMSVIQPLVGSPSAFAVATSSSASACDAAMSGRMAPLPVLTSSTSAPAPAASFFDRMLAVISGSDSTVPVASRIA